jgi:NAD(P)-dependent dehydrogenase (short-subunit alcohol dehydrogenase family)
LLSLEPSEWDRLVAGNLSSVLYSFQLGAPVLRDGGAVLCLGFAGAGRLPGSLRTAAYTALKAGVLVLARSLALELAPRRIRVNVVSPGQLDLSVDLPPDAGEKVPLGRAGTAEEVADAVAWLLSAQASYVTGQDLEVAGGLRLSLPGA